MKALGAAVDLRLVGNSSSEGCEAAEALHDVARQNKVADHDAFRRRRSELRTRAGEANAVIPPDFAKCNNLAGESVWDEDRLAYRDALGGERELARHVSSSYLSYSVHNWATLGRVPITFPRAIRFITAAALLCLWLSALLGFATLPIPLAYATAALLLFAFAFLSLIVPSLVAISEDVDRLDRDFRFTATRLRLGLPIMGDF